MSRWELADRERSLVDAGERIGSMERTRGELYTLENDLTLSNSVKLLAKAVGQLMDATVQQMEEELQPVDAPQPEVVTGQAPTGNTVVTTEE